MNDFSPIYTDTRLSPLKWEIFKRLKACGLLITTVAIIIFVLLGSRAFGQTQTVVEKYGQLSVDGNRIVNEDGDPVQLRGMSLYWSQWIPKYYNYKTVEWLRDDWKITVIRAAMAVGSGGYLTNPEAEKAKVIEVVDAAIALGIYVIIDWHAHEAYQDEAVIFFAEMAEKYGNSPNVLYEPWNEPFDFSWTNIIKPYHEAVIAAIREHDPDNIVICGTRNWSQQVSEAAANPIDGDNIAYSLHYYANTHGQWLRDNALNALENGIALFVTEYGTTDASGDGTVDELASNTWWDFLDDNMIGHANWSVSDIGESSSALISGASVDGGWSVDQIKLSGQLVRNELRLKAPDLEICEEAEIITYVSVNSGDIVQANEILVQQGDNVVIIPETEGEGSWNWYGPDDFQSTASELVFENVETDQAGVYEVSFMNSCKKTFRLSVESLTAVKMQDDNNSKLKIYPNPAMHGNFRVLLPGITKETKIRVYNSQGRLVYEKVAKTSNEVEVYSNLSKGVYFLEAQGEEFSLYRKVIIN